MAKRTLHIMQLSLQFSDSRDKLAEDLLFAMEKEPDLIGLTEVRTEGYRERVRSVAERKGYRAVMLPGGSTGVLVRIDPERGSRLLDRGQVKANAAIPGEYGARYITWVKISWYGEKIFMHAAHWPSGINPARPQPHQRLRIAHHERATRVLCGIVRKHGSGGNLSFFSGDTNKDEGQDNRQDARNMPNQIFRENGLQTIWDEFKVVPRPTIGGSVFDVIGKYRHDEKVKGKRYKVWNRQNSDHSPVSAWYEIDVSKKAAQPTPGGKPGKDKPGKGTNGAGKNEDPYATGGNVSWSDYRDETIYALPQAVDDSDGSNH